MIDADAQQFLRRGDTTRPVAGWYADPAGSGRQRYFDGAEWTHHYAPAQPYRSPPAGWYPDPNGQPRQRYWDGQRWTDTFTVTRPNDEAVRARADQQHRWVLEGDIRGIYGDEGADLMRTFSEPPRQPIGEAATVAKVAHTDDELSAMLEEQPPLWPATAFVSVMIQRREAVMSRLRQVRLGSTDPEGIELSVPEAKFELGAILWAFEKILGQITELITSPGFQSMLGDSYDQAEAELIVLAANRLMDCHEEVLCRAEWNRRTPVPFELRRLQSVLGATLVALLAGFDNFIDGIINRLCTLEEALRYGSFRVEDDPVVLTFCTDDDLAQAIEEVYGS